MPIPYRPFLFEAVGEWLLILPRHASLTAGFAQPLKHIDTASSSPMLPNTSSAPSKAERLTRPTTALTMRHSSYDFCNRGNPRHALRSSGPRLHVGISRRRPRACNHPTLG